MDQLKREFANFRVALISCFCVMVCLPAAFLFTMAISSETLQGEECDFYNQSDDTGRYSFIVGKIYPSLPHIKAVGLSTDQTNTLRLDPAIASFASIRTTDKIVASSSLNNDTLVNVHGASNHADCVSISSGLAEELNVKVSDTIVLTNP